MARQVLHSAKLKDVASAQNASAWYFSAILKAFLKSKTKVRSAMRKFEPIFLRKSRILEVRKLYGDPYIKNRKGIFEFILDGSVDTKQLEVRIFDEATKKAVYATQTAKAEKKGVSNCSHCAIRHDANKAKIWSLSDMDADHVSAWSKGGKSDIKNCEMLCKTHNRAKGDR